MPRPRRPRRMRFDPQVTYFKPQGIPLRELSEVSLAPDEIESLHLKYTKEYDQTTAAQKMNISQSTYQRILAQAQKKITQAVIQGQAIRIQKTSD